MFFIKQSIIRASPERVFAFHESPDALARLTPPWENARVIEAAPNLMKGSRTVFDVKLFGFVRVKMESLHVKYDPPRIFEDVQTRGPFKSWRHRHIFEPHTDGTLLKDEIEFEPPVWFFGKLAAPILILPRLERLFDYRHAVTRTWAERKEEQDTGTE